MKGEIDMKKNTLNTGKGSLFEKIEEQLGDLLVNLVIVTSFLYIIMR
jgi:hypothetical protein